MFAAPDLAVIVDQLSLQADRFSPLIVAHNGSALTVVDSTTTVVLPSILTYGGTCLPNSMYSDALARAAVPCQAFRYSITYLSR